MKNIRPGVARVLRVIKMGIIGLVAILLVVLGYWGKIVAIAIIRP